MDVPACTSRAKLYGKVITARCRYKSVCAAVRTNAPTAAIVDYSALAAACDSSTCNFNFLSCSWRSVTLTPAMTGPAVAVLPALPSLLLLLSLLLPDVGATTAAAASAPLCRTSCRKMSKPGVVAKHSSSQAGLAGLGKLPAAQDNDTTLVRQTGRPAATVQLTDL